MIYGMNGFLTGAALESKQAELALKFYEVVKSSYGSNLSLTGHSLGGGLAGLVAAVNNKTGVLFDNMAFEQAATQIILNLNQLPNDPVSVALKLIISDFATPFLDTSNLATHYMDGEFLALNRLHQSTQKIPYSLGSSVVIPGIDNGVAGGGLHSMSSLAIAMWADQKDANNEPLIAQDWKSASQYFWSVMYDKNFAGQMGLANSSVVNGTDQTNEKYDSILRQIIAYSAIDEGDVVDEHGNPTNARPFGDTAIRALYDDANDLGAVLKLEGGSESLRIYAMEISESFVHYAGLLALNKILNSTETESVLGGVLHFEDMPDGAYLSVDFSAAKWGGLNANVSPQYWLISDGIFKDLSNQSELREQMQILWGDSTTSIFDRALFSANDNDHEIKSKVA